MDALEWTLTDGSSDNVVRSLVALVGRRIKGIPDSTSKHIASLGIVLPRIPLLCVASHFFVVH